ncbi:hypothetical protein KPH14_012836 [Odynerus spinipes]|uniref:Integrase catalytic domain-containing protein n=1 Tax=Odynerus spinipes TaxID=1348599 RepID=A0AAD9VM62_9HYME|nr:hypothetical protein KPH14_012836 [Odynerus spinipes]
MYFQHIGVPKRIVSDRGTSFTSVDFEEFVAERGVQHVKVATATPKANGQVERINRFLRTVLAKLAVEEPWDVKLLNAQFVLNNTHHKTISTTPSQLLFGCLQNGYLDDELRRYFEESAPVEANDTREQMRELAARNTEKTQNYNKSAANVDITSQARNRHFEPNMNITSRARCLNLGLPGTPE